MHSMRRWELHILTFLVFLTASVSRCDGAVVSADKPEGRHLVPLVRSSQSSAPQKDETIQLVSHTAATHAPAIQVSPATLAIIVGLLNTSDINPGIPRSTRDVPVRRPRLLRTNISPNAP
jgi:hypothetical protein